MHWNGNLVSASQLSFIHADQLSFIHADLGETKESPHRANPDLKLV